jgi:hypothetical protein
MKNFSVEIWRSTNMPPDYPMGGMGCGQDIFFLKFIVSNPTHFPSVPNGWWVCDSKSFMKLKKDLDKILLEDHYPTPVSVIRLCSTWMPTYKS